MQQLQLPITNNKDDVFTCVKAYLNQLHLSVVQHDFDRPWGGFFVIDELQTTQFITCFFSHLQLANVMISDKLSPKILVVAPNQRLSWQYHHRRAEIWNLIAGEAAIVTSLTDAETQPQPIIQGETIKLAQGQRHRLVGTNGYGIVAEIWQHTIPDQPSNEDDIIRLQDDYGR